MTLRHYSYCMGIDVQGYLRDEDIPCERAVVFDRERMDRALAGPSITIPNGLTPDEVLDFILGEGHSKD